MEEIGSRFAVFPFDGMAGHQADYIAWLLERCRADNVEPAMIIEPAAVDLLAARLRTPLQIEQYPTRAFEKAFEVGAKVVTATLAETVLSRQIDDLEPRLTRHGYDVKSIAEEFRIKPADVRLFLHGQLDPARRANSPSRCWLQASRCEPSSVSDDRCRPFRTFGRDEAEPHR